MELSRKADILLPGPTWMEEAGTYTALDGRESLLKPKLFDPPEGIRSTKQLLSALAERTGFIQA
jgi:anaerobic selenocysteine-containing dehydrogenase